MFFVGDNNGKEVDSKTLDNYVNSQHKIDSVFGLAKGSYFWCKDIVFDSPITANNFIKSYEDRGFKVYHNIPVIVKGKVETTDVEVELQTLPDIEDTFRKFVPMVEEVKPVEEVKRKGTGRGRGKE